jgi:hypothetical protein
MYFHGSLNGMNIFTYPIVIMASTIRGDVSDSKGVDVTDGDSPAPP